MRKPVKSEAMWIKMTRQKLVCGMPRKVGEVVRVDAAAATALFQQKSAVPAADPSPKADPVVEVEAAEVAPVKTRPERKPYRTRKRS